MAPKLEGRITVPAGGWDASLTGTSSGTATIPAGDYYLSSAGSQSNDLLAEVASQFSDTTGDTVTCTISAGSSGSGKVTLSSDGGTFEVAWTDTDLRDVLGFENDGNLSGNTSYTSSYSARSLWLPNAAAQSLNGVDSSNWAGRPISNLRLQVNSNGNTYAVAGQSRRERRVVWPAVERERVWSANASVTNQDLETFWEDVIYGSAPWSDQPGGPFRFYPDADTDGTHNTYVARGWEAYRPDTMLRHWTDRWSVDPGVWVEYAGAGSATTTTLNAFQRDSFQNDAFQ